MGVIILGANTLCSFLKIPVVSKGLMLYDAIVCCLYYKFSVTISMCIYIHTTGTV